MPGLGGSLSAIKGSFGALPISRASLLHLPILQAAVQWVCGLQEGKCSDESWLDVDG